MSLQSVFNNQPSREYKKGQIIIYQGELFSNIYYIQKGFVKVYDIALDGTEKLIMILGKGDMFPIVWTVAGKRPLRYFYEAYEDAVLCYMSRDELIKTIDDNHSVTKEILRYFVTRTNELMLRIDCIEASSAKLKVAQVMQYLALAHGKKLANGKYKICFTITQQTIANMAGITRETTSLQMTELEKEKVITHTENLLVDTIKLDSLFN